MSTDAGTKLMTADEFYNFVHRSDNANRWFELVRGEVIELPPPTKPHGCICNNVGRLLGNYTFERGTGYVTSNDSGVLLQRGPDTVRGPDVALYEDAEAFDELHPKYGETPPRLAVEVLSPSDQAGRILRKIKDYLRSGVALVWVIDPEEKTVTAHRPDRPHTEFGTNDVLCDADVLPGFSCPVADLFRLPAERKKTPPT
jgi:Uma2 family endonuclease